MFAGTCAIMHELSTKLKCQRGRAPSALGSEPLTGWSVTARRVLYNRMFALGRRNAKFARFESFLHPSPQGARNVRGRL